MGGLTRTHSPKLCLDGPGFESGLDQDPQTHQRFWSGPQDQSAKTTEDINSPGPGLVQVPRPDRRDGQEKKNTIKL